MTKTKQIPTKTKMTQDKNQKNQKPTKKHPQKPLTSSRPIKPTLVKLQPAKRGNQMYIREMDMSGNLMSDIIDTGRTVANNIGTMMTDPLAGALQLPNSILKVIDTGKEVVGSFNSSRGPTTQDIALKGQIPINPRSSEQKILDKISQTQPVVVTQGVPSSYNAKVTTNAMTTEEVRVTGASGRGSAKGVRCRGSQALHPSGIGFSGGGVPAFAEAFSCRVAPGSSGIFGTRLTAISGLYQRWRLNALTIFYVPTMPTDVPGNVALTFLDGTTNNATTATLDGISQRESVIMFRASETGSLTFSHIPRDLWITPSDVDYDPKFYIQAIFQCFTYGNYFTGYPNTAGQLFTVYDVTLFSAAESPLDYQVMLRRSLFDSYFCSNFRSIVPFIKNYRPLIKEAFDVMHKEASKGTLSLVCDKEKYKDRMISVFKPINKFVEIDPSTLEERQLLEKDNLDQLLLAVKSHFADQVILRTRVSDPILMFIRAMYNLNKDYALTLGEDPLDHMSTASMRFIDAYLDYLIELHYGPIKEFLKDSIIDDEESTDEEVNFVKLKK